ncbi:CpsD/CapB family tyrosine-protein kinase [Ureibacillus acetophenoni]|uniref:non-specific protein-tyrosine kinase n=1 Tax=Ureibacillus acetophenoni TaxID=614649 RepID=A0A285U983_9BACL|nr:CpsD/CapB family tyrosine-protein kinase [Ureibacillus acetophenoni]SOC38379.1 capsular exopolysaccharide synthesis family protein [Ureibacillus acetophenoni]
MENTRSDDKQKTSLGPNSLITFLEPKSVIAEQFNTIRSNINFTLPDHDVKKILVTSSTAGEGKSTIASNLAVVFAKEGKRVLIIDADMRRPTLHSTFDIENRYGLSNTLSKKVTYMESVQETFIFELYILPSGPVPMNPSELLASKTLNKLMEIFEQYFDVIIFDAPPLLPVTDAQIISNICDGTILVVNSGKVNRADVLKAKSLLEASHAKILGVVLNNFKLPNNHYYYSEYK